MLIYMKGYHKKKVYLLVTHIAFRDPIKDHVKSMYKTCIDDDIRSVSDS